MAEKRRNKGAAATVMRLWKTMGRQRIRLVIVAVSVIFYTVLSVAAPVYSAGIVDLLWREIRGALENGTGFPCDLGTWRKRDHDPVWDLYGDRSSVYLPEFSDGEFCASV